MIRIWGKKQRKKIGIWGGEVLKMAKEGEDEGVVGKAQGRRERCGESPLEEFNLLFGSACTGFFSSSTLWTWWWVVLPSLPYSLGSTLSSQSAHKACGWLSSPCLNSTRTSETSGWRLWPASAQQGELVWSHLSTSRKIRSHIGGRKKASGIYLY